MGYRVLTAGSGEEALALYRTKKEEIDLVILDLIMPGMGGRKCLKEFVRMNPDVKVVITSGYSSGVPAEDIMQKGASGFIGKPYGLRQMSEALQSVLHTPSH